MYVHVYNTYISTYSKGIKCYEIILVVFSFLADSYKIPSTETLVNTILIQTTCPSLLTVRAPLGTMDSFM